MNKAELILQKYGYDLCDQDLCEAEGERIYFKSESYEYPCDGDYYNMKSAFIEISCEQEFFHSFAKEIDKVKQSEVCKEE